MTSFYTEKCIITGEKAVWFTGHVMIRNICLGSGFLDVPVLAGFKDEDIIPEYGPEGYFGEWKPEYGIQVKNLPIKKEESFVDKICVRGYELRQRFISRLEFAGFNPYMFNEGRACDLSFFYLNKEECLALGMSEYEFNARLK